MKQVSMKIRAPFVNRVGALLAICLLVSLAGSWIQMPLMATAQGTANRSAPSPGDQPVTAGPWTFTISEILTGDQAAAKVAEASGENLIDFIRRAALELADREAPKDAAASPR